jgi:hypothetical protein
MRPVYAPGQDGVSVRPGADNLIPSGVAPTVREIPYDYVAVFKLTGNPGERVQDVINISTDGAFMAVAIGYSFIPARLNLPSGPLPTQEVEAIINGGGTTSGNAILNWLGEILRQSWTGTEVPTPPPTETVSQHLMHCLLTRLCGIDFKYSIIDSGSGRELQNRSIHNIAGLGEPAGNRPFRPFAKPMLFMPRSTIRIEIEQVSQGALYRNADLFIVLHGYKMLGYGTGLP